MPFGGTSEISASHTILPHASQHDVWANTLLCTHRAYRVGVFCGMSKDDWPLTCSSKNKARDRQTGATGYDKSSREATASDRSRFAGTSKGRIMYHANSKDVGYPVLGTLMHNTVGSFHHSLFKLRFIDTLPYTFMQHVLYRE